MAALDTFFRGQVGEFEGEIRDMAAYCLESSGKRLRPFLVFISGWPAGPTHDLVRAAAIVEMVHLATLVHDDIMDNAEMRRGRRTAAREYGAHMAVLLGDALFSQALHVASQFPTPEICLAVSESTRKVCSGEIIQTLRRRDTSITSDEYEKIIDLKTGELFRVSCFLGAKLSGASTDETTAAERFGRHLGRAYQIYDDLVDFLGEERRVGKTLGTDMASGKLTLPLMMLRDRLPEPERSEMLGLIRDGGSLSRPMKSHQMRQLGIASEVAQRVRMELELARRSLAPSCEQPHGVHLSVLCDLLADQVAMLESDRIMQ